MTKALSTTRLYRECGDLRPPLKWAGGKRWLISELATLWRDQSNHGGGRLVEPFCGGLAVALGLNPESALLNDINPHLINFYKWLSQGFRVDVAMQNDRELYYQHRTLFNTLISSGRQESHEAAGLFYYLNRTGYNGLCRFNRSGLFNVPFGRYKSINYISDFAPYRGTLSKWHFTSTDFEDIPLRLGDFVYADPPYDVEFTQYSKNGFAWEDQVRLARWLAGFPGPVVASNQATPRILALYGGLGFAVKILDAPRRISCTGDRGPAKEILATKGF